MVIPFERSNPVQKLLKPLSLIFSFESFFLLYLFAGAFKADPRLDWIPFDITGIFFGISLGVGIYLVLSGQIQIHFNQIILALLGMGFLLWFGSSLMWTIGVEYASQKTFDVLVLVNWCFLACLFIISSSRERMQRMGILLLLIGIFFALSALTTQRNQSGFLELFGSNYLSLGMAIGSGAVATMYFLLDAISLGNFKRVGLLLLLMSLMFYTQLISGGRGPLLSTLAAIVVMFLPVIFKKGIRITRPGWVFISVASVLMVYMLIITLGAQTEQAKTLERIQLALNGQNASSIGVRQDHYTDSLEMFNETPIIGSGIGSWPIRAGVGDMRDYPHNIFLEILVESGLVGLVLFVVLLGFCLRYFSLSDQPETVLCLGLVVFALASALVSGDLSDNRRLLAYLGLTGFLIRSLPMLSAWRKP